MQPRDLSGVSGSMYIDQEGTYDVVVVETADHYFNSGSTGFRLKMQDPSGRTINDKIVDSSSTLWKMKQIAEAAKLTEEQQSRFTHDLLLGRSMNITVEPDGTYMKVSKYRMTDVVVEPLDIGAFSEPQPTKSAQTDNLPF